MLMRLANFWLRWTHVSWDFRQRYNFMWVGPFLFVWQNARGRRKFPPREFSWGFYPDGENPIAKRWIHLFFVLLITVIVLRPKKKKEEESDL